MIHNLQVAPLALRAASSGLKTKSDHKRLFNPGRRLCASASRSASKASTDLPIAARDY